MHYKPKKPPCLACFLGRIRTIGAAWNEAGRLATLAGPSSLETVTPRIDQGHFVYKVCARKKAAAHFLH